MEFTYYGHACFAVAFNNIRLLFDPFITSNPLEAAKKIDVNKIEADYIFLSHGHGDHTGDCAAIASRTGAKIICIADLNERLHEQGITNVHEMNIGGQANFKSGQFVYGPGDFKVKCVVAQHSSSLPDGSYAGSPVGFIVSTANAAFYYAGDTGLTMDMQLIPRWATLDFAVLPVGDNFTMGADDALECARMINCKKIIGVHFDTFESMIKIDHEYAKGIFSKAGYELVLPEIGQTIKQVN